MIIFARSLVTVNILFWMPDHQHILQEFIWQTYDSIPEYPRVNKFLNFWQNEIDAVIKEVRLSDSTGYNITNNFNTHDRSQGRLC